MMAKEIINILESRYNKKLAEEWDNVGLLIGDREKDIKKIQISLDATEKAIDYAIQNNVDMIITHHPMIFKGIKNILFSEVLGRKIIKLIKNDILLYAIHTNLDAKKDGLNDYLLKKLGVESSKILDENSYDAESGIGRIFKLAEEKSVVEYADIIKSRLGIENIRIVSRDENKKIKKIALINGSAMSYWRKVAFKGVELFITGDISYHDALDAMENGVSLIDIGHFESEKCFGECLREELKGFEIIEFNDGPIYKIY